MMMRALAVVYIALLAITGCGEEQENTIPIDAGVRPDAKPQPAQITLQVIKTERLQRARAAAPAKDNIFVGVQLSISNTGEERPIPIDPSTFRLATTGGVLYHQSAQSPLVTMACPVAAAVTKDGTLTCRVVFELPRAAAVSGLEYADDTGRAAAATIATVGPATILCANPSGPFCGSCVGNQLPFNCRREREAWQAACTTTFCVSADTCPVVQPDCQSVPPPTEECKTALDDYQGCVYDVCRLDCFL